MPCLREKVSPVLDLEGGGAVDEAKHENYVEKTKYNINNLTITWRSGGNDCKHNPPS